MLALAALLAFMGCASTPPAPTPPRVTGVTAYLWKVGASDASLAALREPVEDAPHSDPFGEGPAALWQANGVRVLGLPIDAATDLRMQATPSGALREYVIGESPAWAELIRSGRWTAPLLARLDTGDVRLAPGYLRLLCRTWVIPAEIPESGGRTPAAVQLELAIQHVRDVAPARGTLESMIPAAPATIDEQGLILDRLTLSAALDGAHAVVLFPVSLDAPRTTDEHPMFGPPPPAHLRLGNLLLGLPPEAGGGGVTIVLVPSVPDSFGLSPLAR